MIEPDRAEHKWSVYPSSENNVIKKPDGVPILNGKDELKKKVKNLFDDHQFGIAVSKKNIDMAGNWAFEWST